LSGFEHLNPIKLHTFVQRIAQVTTDDAFLFCNIPAFGADPGSGPFFPSTSTGQLPQQSRG
jgi:hypothetical protein